MKKAASIFLCSDITPPDVQKLALWLQNRHVTRYLNEDTDVVANLHGLLSTVSPPMLRYHFNQYGRFFLVRTQTDDPIGFVKLRQLSLPQEYEIVFVIGDETLWGNGYGVEAVAAAQRQVFLEWRARKLVAKIYHGNARSEAVVQRCGFQAEQETETLSYFSISAERYLELQMQQSKAKISGI
ncbi:GNAT family N-acetyltransferase [Oscillibacter sp.]|uniref:GNAT family N-acetyltransferase n=1 Tax=Oscillibacter sp. TaxID=1945593 RepID=UPI0026197554|nr:GNAT family N-acetyltransferase [Oscillibacter sp.]MDD3346519.1 GNAT family N-acetyltransferase [Oscillibacter sp.]